MSFWESVNKELKKAVGEMSTVAKTGKQRLKVHNLHKQAEKIFTDLGGLIYDMAKPPYENPLEDPVVMRLVEEVRILEEEAARIEESISGKATETLTSSAPRPVAPPIKATKTTVKEPQTETKMPPVPQKAPKKTETVLPVASKPPKKSDTGKADRPKPVVKEAATAPKQKPATSRTKSTSATLTSDALTQKVADLLNDGVRQKDIVEILGIVKGTVSKHKKKAMDRGLLK